ncbi:uncharacterized protein LOC144734249 [Lampetra planeri]
MDLDAASSQVHRSARDGGVRAGRREMIDWSCLSEEERESIRRVLERDAKLRQRESSRLRKLSERHGDRPGARLLLDRAACPELSMMSRLDSNPRVQQLLAPGAATAGGEHSEASPLADALGRMVSVCESKFRSLRAPTVSLQLSLFGGERRGGGHERGGGCGYTDEVDMEEVEVVEKSTHVFSSSSTSVTSYTHAKFTSTLQVLMPSPKVEPRRLLERSNSQEGGSALRSLNSGPTPAAHLSRAHEAERRSAPSPRIPRTSRIPSDILTGTSPPPRVPPPPDLATDEFHLLRGRRRQSIDDDGVGNPAATVRLHRRGESNPEPVLRQ